MTVDNQPGPHAWSSALPCSVRQVVAVDADATNLSFIRRSLALGRAGATVRMVHNAVRCRVCSAVMCSDVQCSAVQCSAADAV
jgi:hypothetical protein